ncbi:MAG: hypothetical protein NTV46_14485, partial [Verrucomicrobia bacterium]|nr:hypothetical protein [Verrucomicrobiota bacterium]
CGVFRLRNDAHAARVASYPMPRRGAPAGQVRCTTRMLAAVRLTDKPPIRQRFVDYLSLQ